MTRNGRPRPDYQALREYMTDLDCSAGNWRMSLDLHHRWHDRQAAWVDLPGSPDQEAPAPVGRGVPGRRLNPFGSSESALACATPVGPNETHGSVARGYLGLVEPAQVLYGIGVACVQTSGFVVV